MFRKRTGFLLGFLFLGLFFQPIFGASQKQFDIEEIASRYGAQVARSRDSQQVRLLTKNWQIDLTPKSSCFQLNNIRIFGQHPVANYQEHFFLSRKDWEGCFLPLLTPRRPLTVRRICIDPGHGGNDKGSENKQLKIQEKNLTLQIALRLRKVLQGLGYEVVMTRDNDRFISLLNRAETANRRRCDLFLCIHVNAAEGKSANGIETYRFPPQGATPTARPQQILPHDLKFFPSNRFDMANLQLAYCVEQRLVQRLNRRDRGIKCGRFKVLERLNCPGVLIECGFISHPEEGKLLADPTYQQNIAQAIGEAVNNYAAGKICSAAH